MRSSFVTAAGFLASVLASGLLSLFTHQLIFGHDSRDLASRWGMFPIVHLGFWVIAVCLAYPLAWLLNRGVAAQEQRAMQTAIIASLLSAAATVAFGALNPDLKYFTR